MFVAKVRRSEEDLRLLLFATYLQQTKKLNERQNICIANVLLENFSSLNVVA